MGIVIWVGNDKTFYLNMWTSKWDTITFFVEYY